jgi:hypothetical protein
MGINICDLSPEAQRRALEKYTAKGEKTPPKSSKMRNRPIVIDGIRFSSQAEGRRYGELMTLYRAGRIEKLKIQPEFTLQEAYVTAEGEKVRAIRYVADFSYERRTEPDVTGTSYPILVVEDVKSPVSKTDVYTVKKKLLKERFGISITEVE